MKGFLVNKNGIHYYATVAKTQKEAIELLKTSVKRLKEYGGSFEENEKNKILFENAGHVYKRKILAFNDPWELVR